MPEPAKNPHLPQVKILFDSKNFSQALAELRVAASAADSTQQEKVWMTLVEGALDAELGSPSKALESFRRGLSLAPDALLPVSSEKAEELFAQALKEFKERLLSKFYEDYSGSRYGEALEELKSLEKASTDDKERAQIFLRMGMVLTDWKKQPEAMAAFLEGLDLDPEATPQFPTLSNDVQRLLREARAQLPAHQDREKKELAGLARLAYEEKRYRDTLDAITKYKHLHGLSQQETAWGDLVEGIAQGELGHPAEAEKAFSRVLSIDPETAPPVQPSPEVRSLYERVQSEQRKRKSLREADQLFAAKRYQETLDILTELEQSPALTSSEKPSLYLTMGQAHARLDRPTEATRSFLKALSVDPRVRLGTSASPEEKRLFDRAQYELRHALQPWAWLTGAGSAAAIGGGALFLIQAKGIEQRLRASDPSIVSVQQRQDTVRAGQAFQAAGWSFVGVGVAGIAAGVGLFLFETDAPGGGHASMIITPQGAMAGMAWSLP